MIALLAIMVPASERLATNQNANVPSLRINDLRLRYSLLLALALPTSSESSKRTTGAIALMSPACA